MANKIMHSGDRLDVYAIVAPKVDNVNLNFVMLRGFILPTFRGQCCDWHVIEGTEDGWVFADERKRLKTYYTTMDKKASASKIIDDMAAGNQNYIELFNAEFKALTDIGNGFRIRHHETNKIDITDPRHYDYFFNRCLSLIALAIQYLQ